MTDTRSTSLPAAVAEQIDAVRLEAGKPLIITDADEVILRFVAGLERYLIENGLYLDFTSYALFGNVKRQGTDEPIPKEEVSEHLQGFWRERTGTLDPVEHAAEALEALSAHAQIVVLTNCPLDKRDVRAENLARHGMPYPVIANEGLKGAAVRTLHDRAGAPSVFLDDIPHNLASVREASPETALVHFVADTRLKALLEHETDSEHRSSCWRDTRAFITRHLALPT